MVLRRATAMLAACVGSLFFRGNEALFLSVESGKTLYAGGSIIAQVVSEEDNAAKSSLSGATANAVLSGGSAKSVIDAKLIKFASAAQSTKSVIVRSSQTISRESWTKAVRTVGSSKKDVLDGEWARSLRAQSLKFKSLTAQSARAKRREEFLEDVRAMSIAQSIRVLGKQLNHSAPWLLSMVQEHLGDDAVERQTRARHLRSSVNTTGNYSGGVQKAMVKLNDMMLETFMKSDASELQCADYKRRQEVLMGELAQDKSSFDTRGAVAASKVIGASKDVDFYSEKIPLAEAQLETHDRESEAEKVELHHQLLTAIADAETMDKVLNMTKCSDSAYEKADAEHVVTLLQCVDVRTGRHYTKLQAEPRLQKEFAKLKHPTSLKALSEQIVTRAPGTAFVQQGNFQALYLPYGEVRMNASSEAIPSAEMERCSLGNSSKCPEIRERFVNIAGGIEDAREELEVQIANQIIISTRIDGKFKEEKTLYGNLHLEASTTLAEATTERGANAQGSELKNKDYSNARKEYDDKLAACKSSAEEFKSEQCALHKIRGELSKMSNLQDDITDCDVTDWEEEMCDKSCGGGQQRLTRTVEIYAGPGPENWQEGHDCPALQAVRSCNEDRCPVDCQLNDWSEWSSCTARCDGGSRERTRSVVTHPTANGDGCPTRVEGEICGSTPCDKDCELSAWSEWSPTCSKMCGGGQQTRMKPLKTAAFGDGECKTFYDKTRFQAKPCNTQPCKYHKTVSRCVAKVDVVLVLDGSGSLGEDGWTAVKAASATFARSLSGGAQVGVVLFSGPSGSCELKVCTNQALPWYCSAYKGKTLTPEECGVTWVSHLATNTEAVAQSIEAMRWPGQMTLTSMALKSVASELTDGRQDAQSVVVVITDGHPYSHRHTLEASESLKKSARLMMVPVGMDSSDATTELFAPLVSLPERDNLVFAEDFAALTKSNNTLNQIINDFCPTIATD